MRSPAQRIEAIKDFARSNLLKKAALHCVADLIDDDRIDPLMHEFKRMDLNGDGTLSEEEFTNGVSDIFGISIPEDEIEAIYDNIDLSGVGLIGYTDYVAANLKPDWYSSDSMLFTVFRVFDRDSSGVISQANLAEMIRGSKERKTRLTRLTCAIRASRNTKHGRLIEKEVSRVIDHAEDGHDMNYNDFVLMMRGYARKEGFHAPDQSLKNKVEANQGSYRGDVKNVQVRYQPRLSS